MRICSFDEVPSGQTVMDFIKSQTDWDSAVAAVGGTRLDLIKEPVASLKDPAVVLRDLYDVYTEVGAVNWQSRNTCQMYGLSLTYNPASPQETWSSGSFGHIRYRELDNVAYYTAIEKDRQHRVKGDYLDSLCFRRLHPSVASRQALSSLFRSFACSVHRVTARSINGNIVYRSLPGMGGMHRDESQFESLRVNICLSNNGQFGLQYVDDEPHYAKPGEISFVNTDVMHRAYIANRCDFQRTHIIVNVSPWLNYDDKTDSWSTNEYYGKVHPLDMVKRGLIFKQG